jgi:hypothetical protein
VHIRNGILENLSSPRVHKNSRNRLLATKRAIYKILRFREKKQGRDDPGEGEEIHTCGQSIWVKSGVREVAGRGNGVRLCHYRSGATLSLCLG